MTVGASRQPFGRAKSSVLRPGADGLAAGGRWARAALILGGVLAGVLLMEGGLSLFQQVRPEARDHPTSGRISDRRLGFRMRPNAPGYDANGFRNDRVPDRADIVAIGDSQTWGVNAGPSEAWPAVLGELLSRPVYNMSLGRYGPVQYWQLAQSALKFSPRTIVIGLYLGNDLWDSYDMVYHSSMYAHLRTGREPGDLSDDTITPRAAALDSEVEDAATQFLEAGPFDWGAWLQARSSIVRSLAGLGLWPAPTDERSYEAARAWALAYPEHGDVYESDRVRTVFTPAYRLLALDLDEPRIAEGLRITKEMLVRIRSVTDRAGVRLLVLLIPTKEAAFAGAVAARQGSLSEAYARLVRMEKRVRAELGSVCEADEIECLDALPALAAAVRRDEPIYPPSTDGHPSPLGYSLLASLVKDACQSRADGCVDRPTEGT